MNILVSNDDGYLAPGLAALVEAIGDLGRVTVVAPEQNHSGASNSLTLSRPLSIRAGHNGFWYVNGTPTDCVHLAVTGFLEVQPDLVVSGINDGANMGEDTIYSGTVAAAMEGHLLGIPAIAFSLAQKGYRHLDAAAAQARAVVARFQGGGLAGAPLLNVNLPALPGAAIRGIRATRLGRRHKAEPAVKAANPHGETVYWVGAVGAAADDGPGTDFHAVAAGYVSVTPLTADLTHVDGVGRVDAWLGA
ncbi:MAG: 5'/3'-nucleotidase SurE [Burkholderiales bacterium]|nr:5'/3'-nucleotidase SurE [Burkholderiales bacterium]